jgi:hypothetical protein
MPNTDADAVTVCPKHTDVAAGSRPWTPTARPGVRGVHPSPDRRPRPADPAHRVALRTLFDRFGLRPAVPEEELTRTPSLVANSLDHLPVICTAVATATPAV